MFRNLKLLVSGIVLLGVCATYAASSYAQAFQIEGPADASRIRPEDRIMPDKPGKTELDIPSSIESVDIKIPEGAKDIKFLLKQVVVEGMTAFTQQEISDIYAPYLDMEIPANKIWEVAGRITERYRAKGYFLSRAYVPAQSVKSGIITIKVAEGYIGEVSIEGDNVEKLNGTHAFSQYIGQLKQLRPLSTKHIESFLLKVNDLPGYTFRGVLSAIDKKDGEATDEASIKLTLVPTKTENKGFVGFNNSGSRFLGPNQLSASYQFSPIPLQQTTITAASSLPQDELKYGAIRHEAAVAPNIVVSFDGNVTDAVPGYSLKPFEIESLSGFLGVGMQYQYIRQRDKNLKFRTSLDGRNTKTDILGTPLVRDEVRAIRFGMSFDNNNALPGFDFLGTNFFDFNISQGLRILGGSKRNDINLSRAEAEPYFTKAEMQLSRLQALNQNWAVLASASGQIAANPLFSSEEFGYGGSALGRAFDSSELTGDNGISGSVEVRYTKLLDLSPIAYMPYAFYDAGKVWNKDIGARKDESASSIGFGTTVILPKNVTGNINLAFPLSRDIETPIYGAKSSGPRLNLQMNAGF